MKISVIVPVYKVETTLKRCVDSILRQTYADFELILVDDGSPDCCGLLCDRFAANDARIKVIHKKNGGLSSARNAGLDISQGEYVCFIDSDDYIAENYLELLYSTAEHEKADVVIGGYEMVYPDGNTVRISRPNVQQNNKEAVQSLWRETDRGLYVIVCNKLYRKHLWKDERFPLGRSHEDEFVAHRLLYKSRKTVMIEDVVYYYVLIPNGITHNENEKTYCDYLDALKERKDFFLQNKEHALVLKSGEMLCHDILFMVYYDDKKYRMPILRKKSKKLYRNNFHYLLRSKRSFKEKKYFTLYYIYPKLEKLLIKLRSMKKNGN